MNLSIEYILVCVGNYFTTGQEPDVSPEMDAILDEIISFIKSTKVVDVRSEHVQQCCLDGDHYKNTIETLLFRDSATYSDGIDLSLITFIFALFVKVVEIRTSVGLCCYDILFDTQTLMTKYEMSHRMRSNKMYWKDLVKYMRTTKQ